MLGPPLYPSSSFPLTSCRVTTLERSDLKPENVARPYFKCMTNELLGISVPVICIIFETNLNRSCNETFERHSFHQACPVRNEDSRYDIDARSFFQLLDEEHAQLRQLSLTQQTDTKILNTTITLHLL